MENEALKDARLKAFLKDEMRRSLLAAGRRLAAEKGTEFLTARKLSEASGVSVGTIYNLFATMDAFTAAENMQTLDEVYDVLALIIPEKNPYVNLNRYCDAFSSFVINNANLWLLLYQFHLYNKPGSCAPGYLRRILRIQKLVDAQLKLMFGNLKREERRLAGQVLEMSLFALSGFLATAAWGQLRQVNKFNISKLLLNTYLAGLASLKKED